MVSGDFKESDSACLGDWLGVSEYVHVYMCALWVWLHVSMSMLSCMNMCEGICGYACVGVCVFLSACVHTRLW